MLCSDSCVAFMLFIFRGRFINLFDSISVLVLFSGNSKHSSHSVVHCMRYMGYGLAMYLNMVRAL